MQSTNLAYHGQLVNILPRNFNQCKLRINYATSIHLTQCCPAASSQYKLYRICYRQYTTLLTTNKGFLRYSPDNQFDNIPTMLDNCDSISMKHSFCTVSIDLKQLVSNLVMYIGSIIICVVQKTYVYIRCTYSSL